MKENSIPTYVRSGAFIPMAKPMMTTANYDSNTFDLHYYHDESINESERFMYNDDGLLANAYEKGSYELLAFEAEFEKKELELEFEAENGANFSANTKTITLVIHNISKKPRKVKFRGKRIQFDWNEQTQRLTCTIKWNTAKERTLKIKL